MQKYSSPNEGKCSTYTSTSVLGLIAIISTCKSNCITDYRPRVNDIIHIANAEFYSRKYSNRYKACVQNSSTATQSVQAFMIRKTQRSITPLGRYYTYYKLQTYTKAYSIIAAILESLPGKRLALLKSSSYLCRYRPSLAIYLATEL